MFANRHWNTEVVIESLWWSFKVWTEPPPLHKKIHVWNTPLFLGMALLKIETCNQIQTKFESLLDTFKLEWSAEVGEYIILAIRYLSRTCIPYIPK